MIISNLSAPMPGLVGTATLGRLENAQYLAAVAVKAIGNSSHWSKQAIAKLVFCTSLITYRKC